MTGFVSGDHETLLHTKYISCGPHGFREDFKVFPIIKSIPGRGQFGPQAFNWKDFCRGPIDIATYLIYKL